MITTRAPDGANNGNDYDAYDDDNKNNNLGFVAVGGNGGRPLIAGNCRVGNNMKFKYQDNGQKYYKMITRRDKKKSEGFGPTHPVSSTLTSL